MRPALRLVVIALALTGAQQLFSQTPPTGTGVIRGRVIEIVTAAPVADAEVSFSTDGNRTRRSAQTDAEGRFVLQQVPAGSMRISARKDGYAGGSYGQQTLFEDGALFDLAEGEQFGGMELRIWKHASVSGRVLHATGRPIPGATVQALRLEVAGGVKGFMYGQTVRTDNTGHYQFTRVFPATYGVALVSTPTAAYQGGGGASQLLEGYPTTFYPGVLRPDRASLIRLESGADRRDIDFTLASIPTVSVAGSVAGLPPPDRRTHQIELMLAETAAPTSVLSVATSTITPDGRFLFPKVPPGDYLLKVVAFALPDRPLGTRSIIQSVTGAGMSTSYGSTDKTLPIAPLSPSPTLIGTASVSVADRDLAGIAIALRPAGRISGRVEFVGAAAKPTAEQLQSTPVIVLSSGVVNLRSFQAGRVEADGRFSTVGLPPGRYSLMLMNNDFMMGPAAWDSLWRQIPSTSSVTVGDTDVTGLTYTFTDEIAKFSTEVSGTVRDAAGALRADARIYVFPVDPDTWAERVLRQVRPSRTGRYSVSALPPGEYFVAAVTDPIELWRDSAVLKALSSSAVKTMLSAGETRTLDLRVR